MGDIREDPALSDFFGPGEEVTVERGTTGRVAFAKDNARLFVGNVINQYGRTSKREVFSIDASSTSDSVAVNLRILTVKVLKAVTKVTDRLRTCQKQAARVKIADLSVAALHIECATIRLHLNQIQAVIDLGDKAPPEDRSQGYLRDYEDVLQSCCLPFSILNRHLENVGLGGPGPADRDVLEAKLQALWAYERMEEICYNIRGLARGVDIVSSSFQSGTLAKASNVIGSSSARKLLANVTSDAVSLHESFVSATGVHERSIRDSIMGDEVFEFDNVLTNTTLYKKAYMRRIILSQNLDRERDGGQEPDNFHIPSSAEELAHWQGGREQSDENEGDVNRSRSSGRPAVVVTQPKLRSKATMSTVVGSNLDTPSSRQATNASTGPDVLNQKAAPVSREPKPRDTGILARPVKSVDVTGNVEDTHTLNNDWVTNPVEYHSPHSDRWASRSDRESENNDSVSKRSSNATLRAEDYASDLTLESRLQSLPTTNRTPEKGKNRPTLSQVVGQQTVEPYTLYNFDKYMRNIQVALHYWDFWLSVKEHKCLTQFYHRQNARLGALGRLEVYDHVRSTDLKASAEKILYTYVLPGSEREIVLPDEMFTSIVSLIEEHGDCSPSVFDHAKDWVFELIDRDTFPGFLEAVKPLTLLHRMARKALGPLANIFIRP